VSAEVGPVVFVKPLAQRFDRTLAGIVLGGVTAEFAVLLLRVLGGW
jgi:hypothetical protein